MNTFVLRTRSVWLCGLMAWLSGCGGGAKPVSQPIKVNPPVVVHNGGQQPAAKAAPRNEAANGADRKEAPRGKAKALPPGTDPKSVFEVAAIESLTDVDAPRRFQPEDQFAVVSGVAGTDATRLVVADAGASSNKNVARTGFSLPVGFTALPGAGYSEGGLPLRIECVRMGTKMALVPAGVFKLGSHDGPSESQPELSMHLDDFYMDVLEVTVGDFEVFRQDLKDKKKPLPPTSNPTASPNTPVLGVPYAMALAYARWLDLELPTEAQFEKAARGPNSLRTPWGDGRAVWPIPRTPETLTVTGAFANDRSPYGIYDLAGNAREWCSDLYSEQAHRDAIASSSQTPRNWAGPKKVPNTNLRVVKGNAPDWSAWGRQGREIGKGHPDVGFRCVLKVTVPEAQ